MSGDNPPRIAVILLRICNPIDTFIPVKIILEPEKTKLKRKAPAMCSSEFILNTLYTITKECEATNIFDYVIIVNVVIKWGVKG